MSPEPTKPAVAGLEGDRLDAQEVVGRPKIPSPPDGIAAAVRVAKARSREEHRAFAQAPTRWHPTAARQRTSAPRRHGKRARGRADRLRSQDRVRQGSAYPPPPCRADPAARPDRVKATERTRPLCARRLQSAPVRRALRGQLLLHLHRLPVGSSSRHDAPKVARATRRSQRAVRRLASWQQG